ncbi:YgfZ/GcvT domain-containing protein [Mangrovicella endophytica]|uniref:CAF17-like 4Fe-4S cluster assembly/insertion protein YgfZ n=1 Tax=Mangrovicella endophytica TaxID=2066697 RepID=UPI000C9E65B7|nr:folate-binding protein YgfZ [Mangrovicella endophytica]
MPFAPLTDRATIALRGEAAEGFLQNLVTSDVSRLQTGEARPSALLTPQGKILFDFLLSRIDDGVRVDCAAGARGDLIKRLTLYRLRTKIAIEPEDVGVVAIFDEETAPQGALRDMRFADQPVYRLYGMPPAGMTEAEPTAFVRLRVQTGVAEAERDFPASDVFPHDVLLDQNGGVSFAKGCYVGQEVVSRMQHRGTARRRLMLIEAERHLTPGANIEAGSKVIGTVLTASGTEGIGLVRIDRVADALAGDATLSADGVPLTVTVPPWAGYTLPMPGDAEAAPAEGA